MKIENKIFVPSATELPYVTSFRSETSAFPLLFLVKSAVNFVIK